MDLLNKLDNKKFGWFHSKIILISGIGFFSQAYNVFSITFLTPLLGRIYYQDDPFATGQLVLPGKLPLNINICLIIITLVGTLVGQIFFGYFGDKVGRKQAFGSTLLFMVICAFSQVQYLDIHYLKILKLVLYIFLVNVVWKIF
jgi:PHS family inorganic phosphate transporter-like MFS transporter